MTYDFTTLEGMRSYVQSRSADSWASIDQSSAAARNTLLTRYNVDISDAEQARVAAAVALYLTDLAQVRASLTSREVVELSHAVLQGVVGVAFAATAPTDQDFNSLLENKE